MVDLSLLQDFIAETAEYLEEMEDILLRLEADPGNRMMLDDVFRSVHTIKGAAEYLGIERIAQLSRTIENMLYHLLRQSDLRVSQEIIDLLMDGQKRIALLTDNLHQTQAEQVEIDDLIERIRETNTTSKITGAINQDTAGANQEKSSDNAAIPDLEDNPEDENDEELFTIFLEQLEDKLGELQTQIAALQEADDEAQATILDVCLSQIEPLSSSANYMGYEHLVTFYEEWTEEIQTTKGKLGSNDQKLLSVFICDCMEANITELIRRYPRLQISSRSTSGVTPETYETKAEDTPAAPIQSKNAGNNMSDDILEEYAESTPSPDTPAHNETNKGKTESDTNLFAQLSWSFDNRIKQNTAKPIEADQVEIESELFSTSKSTVSNNEELQTKKEVLPPNEDITFDETTVSPIMDDYEEENDEELFTIFEEQLGEKLAELQVQTIDLQATDDNNQIAILDICLEQIDRLSASANYMGYKQLTDFFEAWSKEVAAAQVRLHNHDNSFMPNFVEECMQTNIAAALSRFPRLVVTNGEIPVPLTTTDSKSMADPELTPGKKQQADEDATDDLQEVISDLSMLPDFIIETREHLEEMEEKILSLEADADRQETLNDIFRAIHTIKGAAEYLGIKRIAKLTHNLENLLYQLRQNKLQVDREVMDLLMAGWDRISLLTDNLEQDHTEKAKIADLLERISIIDGSNSDTITDAITLDKTDSAIETAANTDTENIEEALKTENTALLQGTDRRDEEKSIRRQSDQINEKTLKQNIRVDASKIDALMNQVGELVVSRAGFTQLLSDMQNLQHELKQNFKLDIREMRQLSSMTFRLSEATSLFGKVTNELQEEVMKVRMLPISQLFNRYPRLVFDLVRDTGKKVQLDIHGEDTELDKMVIEEISDPLIHIIRNAVDHGIEPPAERLEKGKPEVGTIRLKAYHEGNHVVIEIMDDGRGLDLNRIKEKAVAEKFISHSELEHMSTQDITGLIMKPGFSTKEAVTHLSGRGVGMDVVRKNIEKLNGTIEIDTTPGVSMYFRIKIPLTLAIIPALRIRVSSELFTIPLSTVEETLRIFPDEISTIEGAEVMSFRGSTLPLVRVVDLFNLEKIASSQQQEFVVVVSTGMKHIGLIVDDLLGQEEVVIKPLEDYIQERSGFSGATILGDGKISLILDVYELINLPINRKPKK